MDPSVKEMFESARFISHLGMNLARVGKGEAETTLQIKPEHLQQHDFVHAGVQATMADHTAGVAASSLLLEGEKVMTIEFKINFLRPAAGDSLRCKSTVLRRGRTVVVAESAVYIVSEAGERLTSKAMVTLAVLASNENS